MRKISLIMCSFLIIFINLFVFSGCSIKENEINYVRYTTSTGQKKTLYSTYGYEVKEVIMRNISTKDILESKRDSELPKLFLSGEIVTSYSTSTIRNVFAYLDVFDLSSVEATWMYSKKYSCEVTLTFELRVIEANPVTIKNSNGLSTIYQDGYKIITLPSSSVEIYYF
ncbi:MAG: hypothetical protein E7359_02800 [Clostridiales bacterium]|nr:hypothetical protein [Clostridiales bacterium]